MLLLQKSMNRPCSRIVVLASSAHEEVYPALECNLGVVDAMSQRLIPEQLPRQAQPGRWTVFWQKVTGHFPQQYRTHCKGQVEHDRGGPYITAVTLA